MGGFTGLDLGDEPPPGFGEHAHAAAQELFPPFVLGDATPFRTFTGTDADKDTNVPRGPFTNSLLQRRDGGVVVSGPFVDEDSLTDLNGFESQSCSARGSAGLPDRTVEFRRWFFSRIVRPQ